MSSWHRWTALGAVAAALSFVSCTSSPVAPDSVTHTPAATLTGQWNLVLLQDSVAGTEHSIENPERFQAEFADGGRLHVGADCNRCNGSYTAGSEQLSVGELMACTLAYCRTAPLDTRYVGILTRAQTYTLRDGELEIAGPEGLLLFRR